MNTKKFQQPFDELHYFARLVGILAAFTALLYLRALVVGSMPASTINSNQIIALVCLLLGIVGLILAWRWERAGGLLAIISAIPIAWVTASALVEGRLLVAFVYSSPFLIAGALYLYDARRRQQRELQ